MGAAYVVVPFSDINLAQWALTHGLHNEPWFYVVEDERVDEAITAALRDNTAEIRWDGWRDGTS